VDAFVHMIESLMATFDPYTVSHQQRVAQLSTAIAREMGLEERQISNLETAARLHDFGKISVPIGILSNRGELSVREMAMIKRHPTTGCDILKPRLPVGVLITILQHHERINGSGYPFGLSGEDILLEARILGVADVMEAMSSHRPYRPALGMQRALAEICQNRGILYDALVVDAMMRIHSTTIWDTFFFHRVAGDETALARRAA
jgi:HD-GYP domain-containing protein (c-di-GMP phosphodiesterase class II)